jgi:dynein heavy chain
VSTPQVAKVVAPKKAKLGEAEAAYQKVMVGLTAKQKELHVGVWLWVAPGWDPPAIGHRADCSSTLPLCSSPHPAFLPKGLLDRLAAMEAELRSQQSKKEQLEADIELCSVKLDRAEKLIGGLGGEKARWEEAALNLAKAQVRVWGVVMVVVVVVTQGATHPALSDANGLGPCFPCAHTAARTAGQPDW